ncbi:MAG: hypothetical protein RI883_251, partial [Bacteroidota bacterium]
RVSIPVTPGQTVNYSVGAGGNYANSNPGTNGQLSSVTYNSAIVCSAAGGIGGGGGSCGSCAMGGGGTSGVGYMYAGGNGGTGAGGATYNTGGGGGGAAGNAGNGLNGTNGSGTNTSAAGGAGGSGVFGSGTGGAGCVSIGLSGYNCPGNPGGNYGAGGSGGGGLGGSSSYGGTGSTGKIVITFCVMSLTSQPSTSIQNLCVGGASTALTVSGTGLTTYQWYSNTTPSNSGGTLISGATTASYTPPTGISGSKYYYCIVGNGTCNLSSNASGAINVGVASIVSSSSTILCGGGSVTLTASAQGATSYLWSTGATTSSITVSPTANTTYTVTVNGTCGSLNQSITVNYSPPISFSAITTSANLTGFTGYPTDIIYLNSYPVQTTIFTNGFNGSWNSWTTSTSGTNTNLTCSSPNPNLTAMPALTLSTGDPNLNIGGTAFPYEGSGFASFNSYYTAANNEAYLTSPTFSTVGLTGVTVDFVMVQFTNSSCGAGEYVKVQYNIGGGWVNVPAAQYQRDGVSTQCPSWMNFAPTLPAAALGQPNVQIRFVFHSGSTCGCGLNLNIDDVRVTGVSTPGGYSYFSSYNWSASGSAASLFSIVSPTSRGTQTADLNDQTTTGVVMFSVTMTDINGCVYTAATDTIRVNPSTNGGAGTSSANPTTVCPGGSSTLTYVASGSVPATLQWQYSTTGAGGPWYNISGGTTSTYTYSPINQTTWFRVQVTDGQFVSGICGSTLYSSIIQVVVQTFNNGIIQNTGESVGCGGDPIQFGFTTLPSTTAGTYSVQWYATNGSTSAPTGSTVPVGWTGVGAPMSPVVTVVPTQTFSGAGLPAGWAFGSTPATIGTSCGGAGNAINFNTSTTPWGQSVTSEVYSAPVSSLSFVHGATGGSWGATRTSTLTVEAWNGSTWTLVTGGTVFQNTAGTACSSSVKSFTFSPSLNYTQFRVTRTAGTSTKVAVDDWNVTTTANVTYNPLAGASSTTTYAAYVTFTGGACTNNGWATYSWTVNFTGGGTSTDWTGAIDTDWFKSGNWSCGLPACGIDANIPSAPTNQPVITYTNGTNASCNSIVIYSGASLTTTGSNDTLRVCGNWTKNGTYYPNTGAISFVGDSAQTMYTPATTFYNLIIKNTEAGVTINADETVTNVLTLIDGVVTTNANYMIISISTPANVVNGGANPTNYTNSWINGNIRRAFAENTGVYDFPVGCATYSALARLTNGSLTGISVMDAYYVQTLTTATPLDPTKAIDFGTPYTSCFTDGYWFLEPSTGSVTGGNYNLKLYYNGWSSINSSYDNKYGMVKRPTSTPTSMAWSTQIPTDGAGTLNAANGSGRVFASGYAERNNMTMFSHFAIAYAIAPLPIELISFTGTCSGNDKLFSWSTASELNNQYFTIEQSSDGQNYSSAAIVQGAGTTSETQYYSIRLSEVSDELTYFRLKQTDFDGKSKVSDIIYVGCESDLSEDQIWLFPNPANNQITLTFGSSIVGNYAMSICDLLGKEIRRENITVAKNGSQVVDINQLAAGNYLINFVNIESGDKVEIVKFTKIH